MKLIIAVILLAFAYLIGSVSASTIIPFSSPENSYGILSDYISGLKKTAYISVYTFTSGNLAWDLIEAEKRGVNVKVIIDDKPIGEDVDNGLLCALEDGGAEVYLYKGKLNFLHAKYIIGDNSSSLISTGNFGPGSFNRSREWEAIIEDENISRELLSVYLNDIKNSKRFKCKEKNNKILKSESENVKPAKYADQKTELVIAPDAVGDVLDFIKSAKKSLYIEQLYIYKTWGNRTNLFLEAAINKARNGAEVKILMDSNAYNINENDPKSNYNTMMYINNISKIEKIPIEARLADMKSIGVSTIHAKGIIADNKMALISSINWNENSPRNNREVGVVIEGSSVEYFVEKFLSDWSAEKTENYPPSGKASSQKLAKKDYNERIFEVAIFIIAVSSGMVLIKKKVYKRKRRYKGC